VRTIRTLVVDDEPLARDRILMLLRDEPDVEVVGECGDGPSAVDAIERLSPELVFLDVQMPESDAFAVIRSIDPSRAPMFIFVTAYDQYALRAFDVHAVDYLLKPFDRDRFSAAVQHARRQLERQDDGLDRRLRVLIDEKLSTRSGLDRIVVRSGGRIFFLRTEAIDWIEAAGNYLRIHVGSDAHMIRETMNDMETRLDAGRFARIHRSRIVNIDRVKEMQPLANGEYTVILHDGTRLTLSRGFRDKLQARLGKVY
jgi:two-component system LytT family response regulator